MSSQGRALRVRDVAAYLRVSQQRGAQMHAEGKLPKPDRVDGIGPLWKPATIERWAEQEWWGMVGHVTVTEASRQVPVIPSLSGPRLKLERAEAHLVAFKTLAQTFIREETERIDVWFDAELSCKIFRLNPRPTPPEWGPIIGDVLYNCRSSLDQLANQLAGGDRNDRQTAFPICLTPDDFEKKAQRDLARMPPEARLFVEGMQPFKRTDKPEYDYLWFLNELCNEDKHRQLHLTVTAIEGAHHIEELSIADLTFGRLTSGFPEILGAVNVTGPDEDAPLNFMVDIAFQEVSQWSMPLSGVDLLDQIVKGIAIHFRSCETLGLLSASKG